MKFAQKSILVTLLLTLFVNPTFAAKEGGAISVSEAAGAQIVLGKLLMSSGAAGAGAWSIEVGVSLAAVATLLAVMEISENSQERKKLVKAVVLAEAANYQATGEMGVILESAMNSIRVQNNELSDFEIIDAIVETLN